MISERRAYLLLLLVILLWGMNWPMMKVGVELISPLWFTAIRLLLGAAFLFALLGFQNKLVLPVRHDLPAFLSVAVLQFALGLGLVHVGLTNIEAGRSAILAYTTPLWVVPMAVLVLGERITWAKAGGLLLGMFGLGVLFNPATFDISDRQQVLSNALLIASAIVLAVVIIQNRRHDFIATPLQLMPWQMVTGGVILAITALFAEGIPDIPLSGTMIGILAYNGPIATAFCLWAYATVMRSLPATSTAFGSLGVPVSSMVFASLTLGEPLGEDKIMGLTLILSGVGVLVFSDLRKKHQGN